MKQKLFAFVATLAIVLSMFSGLTLAAAETHKFILNTATMVAGSPMDIKTVTGSIVLQSGAYDGQNFTIHLTYTGGSSLPKIVPADAGQVNFYLPTDLPAQNVQVHAFDSSNKHVASTTIKAQYNVTTSPTSLNFSYDNHGIGTPLTGTVKDGRGQPVVNTNVLLRWASTGISIAAGLTGSNGEFGFIVPRLELVGDIELVIADVVHKTGKVGGIQANLSVTPNSNVPHTIATPYFTIQGSGFSSYGSISLSLRAENGQITNLGTVSPGASGTFTRTLDSWRPMAAGTYTLEATQGVYSASTTIRVVNPSGYNFVNTEKLTDLRIGDASRNQLQVGSPNGAYLVTWNGNYADSNFYYDVYVDGQLEVEKRSNATFGIAIDQFGTKAIRVVAYRLSGSSNYTYVHERTFTAKVSGWNVTLSNSTFTVNETRDLTIVVKNENGTPMNNATVRVGSYELNPYNYNSQNGTYTFKDLRFTNAGPISVVVKQGDIEQAQLTLNVVGQKVYQLSSSTSTLLQGQSQTVRLNVSKGNQSLLPQILEMEDSKGKTTVVPFNVVSSSGSYAVIDAVITPELVGDLLVRARNFTGTECGETKLTAVATKLVLIDTQAENVTENIKTKVRFKVVDPRDNSTLQSNVTVTSSYAAIKVYDSYDSELWNNTLLGAPEHTISILATDAQYEDASDAKANVAVVLKINDAAIGSFPIKAATLESDPKMIVIGVATPLTLTYKDASDKPIVDKMVQVQEGNSFVNVGRTDSSGKVAYPAAQGYGTSVIFQAATDVSKQFVKGEVRFGYDNEAPKVTYSKESKTAKTTIVITDNVRLTRLRINGTDIDLFAGKRYEHTLELKPGLNKFRIEAQDNNYNYLDETIEINYVTSTTPPATGGQAVKYTIGKTTYYVDGVAKQLEAAPFLRGNNTLVPVRALESIGAIFAWDNATRTATFQLDGNVVKVTIGKTTAVVNGKATAMPAAAEIVNDRTMVPFRFIGQSLGLQVDYIDATKDIIITRK